jgi:hypothetical protein
MAALAHSPRRRGVLRGLGAIGVALAVAVPIAGAAPRPPQPGDSRLFDTWTGYQSGRFLEAVVSTDLNGDGKPDAAWARNDFYQNRLQVQFNVGDGTLGAPVAYPVQSQSNDIAAGDLNGDSSTDLVVVSQGDNLQNPLIDVYLNNGTGTFTHSTVTGGQGAMRVALADLNSDGRLDLAVTNYWAQSADISVLLNTGNGNFGPQTRYPIGYRPYGIAAADLDGDGRRDLAVGWDKSPLPQLSILKNDGTGKFALAKTLSLSFFAESIVVTSGDWNGDGRPDLAAAGSRADKIAVLTNGGGFSFTENAVPGGFSSFNLRAIDIDGDGKTDLLSPSYGSDTGEVTLLRNAGNGTFAPPIGIESGRNPHDVDAADYNGDGRLDLAVANRVTDTGAVHPQRADGSFAAPPIYRTAGQLPLSVATADFDRDGDVDVAEGSGDVYEGARVETLMNAGDGSLTRTAELPACTICAEGIVPYVRTLTAADLNGDGASDLLWAPDAPPYPYVYALNTGNGSFGTPHEVQIATCGTGAATAADVNNDGRLDVMVANNRGGPGTFCETVGRTVRVALNKGDGTFQSDYGVNVFPLPEMAVGADLNADGKTDIVAVSAKVSVATGTGGGAFAAPVFYDARGTRLKAFDVNGDGAIDVATADLSTSTASVLKNDGTGGLSQITVYPGEQIPGYANDFALDLGDIDGDGRPDLVVANPSGNNVGVHFGLGGGVFGDEQVRYGAHSCFLDVRLADMNADGRLDIVGPACIGSSFVTPRGVTVLLGKGRSGGPPPGAIAGKIKDKQAKTGIGGAKVDCKAGGTGTTDATGRYRIAGVPPGRYACTAAAAGYKPQTKSVTVVSGRTKTLNFVLRKT